MHRALQIVEVVEMVCAQVAASDSLTRLARTSTIFMNPALNVLWRHQSTIANILRCMPEDLWDITEFRPFEDNETVDLNITLRRPVDFADWDRFYFYSARVKSFSIDSEWLSLLTAEVYEVFNLCLPQDFVFPNLRKLEWDPYPLTLNSFHHIRLFLAPTITSFSTSLEKPSHISLLSTLAHKCPHLTRVTIGGGGELTIPAMSRLVCRLHHLEALVAPGLDRSAFSHIAGLPCLHSLWLMSFVPPIPPFLSSSGSLPFPSLKDLQIETIEDAPAFFEILFQCSLEQLTILSRGLPVPYTNKIFQRCWSALATHCSHSSLQELDVQGAIWDSLTINADQLDMYTVGGDTLRPLFPFRSLVMVSLVHPVGFDIDDGVVREMACAWPRIEFLSLSARHFHHIRPRVTLEAFCSFAKYCPRLQVLNLTLDATVIPQTTIDVPLHRLTQINVQYSPIGEPLPVAEFLFAIFPCLWFVQTWREEPRIHPITDPRHIASHEGWQKVEEALRNFQGHLAASNFL